jgi:hypothetical protein
MATKKRKHAAPRDLTIAADEDTSHGDATLAARSPERQRLATAIAQRDEAMQAVEAARQALDRGRSRVAEAEAAVEAARAATAEANAQRAEQLEVAAAGGTSPPPSTTHRVKASEDAATDELAAVHAAVEGLRQRLGQAEDRQRAATHMVVALADNLIRRSIAARALAAASAAAERLQRARLFLRLALAPQEVGQVPIYGMRRLGIFDEDWNDAAARHGRERANRRMSDADRARALRDEDFADVRAAAERHLERALADLRDGEERWYSAPELEPWRAARQALIGGDPDAPLPA